MRNKKDLWLCRQPMEWRFGAYVVFVGKKPRKNKAARWGVPSFFLSARICSDSFHRIFADRLPPGGGPVLWAPKVKT